MIEDEDDIDGNRETNRHTLTVVFVRDGSILGDIVDRWIDDPEAAPLPKTNNYNELNRERWHRWVNLHYLAEIRTAAAGDRYESMVCLLDITRAPPVVKKIESLGSIFTSERSLLVDADKNRRLQ